MPVLSAEQIFFSAEVLLFRISLAHRQKHLLEQLFYFFWCFQELLFLKIWQILQENNSVGDSLQAYRLQNRCFPVKFAKFLRALFLKSTSSSYFCTWNFMTQVKTLQGGNQLSKVRDKRFARKKVRYDITNVYVHLFEFIS